MRKIQVVPTNDVRERFILWLASKPANEEYEWTNAGHCACATFVREQLTGEAEIAWEVWRRWNMVFAEQRPWTYGALLKRVREAP